MPESRTYSQKVAATLKTMLLEGKLAPGDRVHEVALATELGVSRAPIREALHMLVSEGLVVNLPQRGKFITSLTPEEIHNSYFVGGVLEGAAAASCAQTFDETDFAHMAKVLDDMESMVAAGKDMQEIAPLDTAFHEIIFSRINNPLLKDISRYSCLRVSKFLLFRHWQAVYTPAEFHARHVCVLQALQSRDAARIETCLREHYRDSGERLAPFGREAKGAAKKVK